MDEQKKQDLEAVLKPEIQHEAIAAARALCPFAETVTDQQMMVCIAMVEAKGDMKSIAEYLGFDIGRVRQHLQFRLAGKVMRQLSRHKLSGIGFVIAQAALMDVAGSAASSTASRNKAAQTIVSMAEEEAVDDKDVPDLANLTLKQLEQLAGKLRAEMMNMPHLLPPVEQV